MGWNSGMEFIENAADMAWGNISEEEQIELMRKIIIKTQSEDCDVQAEYLGKYKEYDEAYRRVFGDNNDDYKKYALINK